MPDPSPILEVSAVSKQIDSGSHVVRILEDVDFSVPHGQFMAIRGPSGSGKSTLLGLLAGLDAPSAGRIRIDGVDITDMAEDDLALLRARKIGFVFQSYQLVPTLTAEENVLLPLDLLGETSRGAVERARKLLAGVGLEERLDHYPVQLSGGEQQRVALARAFINRPPLILADEPTGNLDTATGDRVLEILWDLNRREGASLVLVTHDESLARQADRIITLRDGRIVEDQIVRSSELVEQSS